MSVAELPRVEGELKALLKAMADKDIVAVKELPRNLQAVPVLAQAFAQGLIEIGQRSHTTTNKIHYEKNEHGQEMPVHVPIYHVERNIDWLDHAKHRSQRRKPLREILVECDALPAELGLLVRLTTDGQAVV